MKSLQLSAAFVASLLWISLGSSEAVGQVPLSGRPSSTPRPVSIPPPVHVDPPKAKVIPIEPETGKVDIPGPLRSFLRMAGISQQIEPEEVLPLLAQNVYIHGYQQKTPTEFLLLLQRYVEQAQELQTLAGPTQTLSVKGCDDAGTLTQILGYRMRPNCGQKTFFLETANPERAFITIDSGFPLNDLEEALQKGTPFTYAFPVTHVPVILREADWQTMRNNQRKPYNGVMDMLLRDPVAARLYRALARQNLETRQTLQRTIGLNGMLPIVPTLDFYGSQLSIRNGRVQLPGGPAAEAGWKELVGANSNSPGDFVNKLMSRDNGWLAVYFDAISRVSQDQQAHLTQAPRLKNVYNSLKLATANRNATHGVFRHATQLLVLFTRVQWEADGSPRVPGDLAVWNQVLRKKTEYKLVHDATNKKTLTTPDQLFEIAVACAPLEFDDGPTQLYLTLSEIDRERKPANRLTPETARLLADNFSQFSKWYLLFTEFPDLDDASITRFVEIARSVDKNNDQKLRANLAGSFQSIIGLWQILARQGEIPNATLNASWQKLIAPFATITNATQLFDASHDSLKTLFATVDSTPFSLNQVVNTLAGPRQTSPEGQRTRAQLAGKINAILEEQRLVSIDTLFNLSDGLKGMQHGTTPADSLLPLAAELREFDLPRPIFTNAQKISWSPTIYTTHHAELQIKTDLAKTIKAASSPAQLEAARGQLAPFLRDALVGLIYAYYEPPGAQMIHHNSLLVRSHDFIGVSIWGAERLWDAPRLLGAGSPAGGGGFLMGSLTDFPYAISTIEQDFIAPQNVQALIWKESVPNLLVGASLPRWWDVTPAELHAVTLFQRSGEEILTSTFGNQQLQTEVLSILSDSISPQRIERIEAALAKKDGAATLLPQMLPAETTYLAAEMPRRFPTETADFGPFSQQLAELRKQHPAETSWERLSRDFGVPHPELARTNTRELLSLRPFPFAGGISSRLFGETWESSNLYWARLADEMGYSPVALNLLAPDLTRHMVEKIFATDLEDWPAMFRAMKAAGEDFKHSKLAQTPATIPAANLAIPTTTTVPATAPQTAALATN